MRFLGVLCGATCLLVGSGTAALAQPSVPAAGPTNLSIASERAHLVGPEALILVRCEGPRTALCNGTLSVSLAGKVRREPFSVFAGSRQSVDVSLGRGLARRARTAVAVARTVQAAGGSAQSRAVLHFR
jgi:hypothetical protein